MYGTTMIARTSPAATMPVPPVFFAPGSTFRTACTPGARKNSPQKPKTTLGMGASNSTRNEPVRRSQAGATSAPDAEDDAGDGGEQLDQDRAGAAQPGGRDLRQERRRADAQRHGQGHRDRRRGQRAVDERQGAERRRHRHFVEGAVGVLDELGG